VLGKILSGVGKNSIRCWRKFYQVLRKFSSGVGEISIKGKNYFYQGGK
jgi:hypothetical protein